MHETRVMGANRKYYAHEMSTEAHIELLDTVLALKGYVVLSGYDSPLYNEKLADWGVFTTTSRISAGRGSALRNEMVWLNPACVAALELEPAQASLI